MSVNEAIGRVRSGFGPALPVAGRHVVPAMVAVATVALLYQLRWGIIPDTSWLITVCERVLAGEQLYRQIYETNPPFTVWMYLPPVAAANALGIAPEIAVHAWTYLATVGGLALAVRVARQAGFPENAMLLRLAPAFFFMLVIFPGNAFSEREHIGMALFLPILVMTAWRARPDAAAPHVGLAALTGLSASVLLLVKPYYAVMVLMPGLFAAWRRRSAAPIFAVENWVIGVVCSSYLASVLALHPEFVRDVYPLLADTYLKIRAYLAIVVMYGTSWAALMLLVWRFWPREGTPELASVMTIASAAGMVPLLYQAKGWAYHAYPALLCAILALLCLAALPGERRKPRWTGRFPLLMNPPRALVAVVVLAAYAPFWVSQKPPTEVVETIRGATRHARVASIGADLAAGHPLVRMAGGRWVSFYNSDWLGVFATYLTAAATATGDAAAESHYRRLLDDFVAFKRGEFERERPDVVVVDTDDEFWLRLLTGRFGFDRILADYRIVGGWKNMRVYLRNDLPTASAPETDISPAEIAETAAPNG